jgi:hypothetical protein
MAKKPGTAIVDWEKEMAAQAEIAAGGQRSSGGGKFFSMRAGQLTFDGEPLPGNQVPVIILADIIENYYYDKPFDPDVPASPICFAFAHSESEMEPHEAVDQDDYFERQSETCRTCPKNEWGSAPVGRGKACKNSMRLAMIPAGVYKPQGKGRNAGLELELYDDTDDYEKSEIAYMKLPVMSVRNYSTFVRDVATNMRRPPHGIITNIAVVPDPRSQFKVEFEVIEEIDNELIAIIMARHATAKAGIDFPYTPPPADEAPPPVENKKLRRRA